MNQRAGEGAPAGEIRFSDDELSTMNAVVLGGAGAGGAASDAAGPGANGADHGGPTMRPTVRQRAFNPLDVLVDAAFSRDGGPPTVWHHHDDDGIEPAEPVAGPLITVTPGMVRPTRPMAVASPTEVATASAVAEMGDSTRATIPSLPVAPPPSERSTLPNLPAVTEPPVGVDGDPSLATIPSLPVPPPAAPPSAVAVTPVAAPVVAAPPTPSPSVAAAATAPVVASPPAPSPSVAAAVTAAPSVVAAPAVVAAPPALAGAAPAASAIPPPSPPAAAPTSPPNVPPPPAAAIESSRSKTSPSMPVASPGGAAAPVAAPPPVPPGAAASAVSSDPRLKTTPSMPAVPAPSAAPASGAAPAVADGRPRTVPPVSAGAGAAPAMPPPPATEAKARPTAPPPSATPRPSAESNGARQAPSRPDASLLVLEDAVFSSSSPPDEETLRFTVPDPLPFRVVVAPETPRLDAIPAAVAAAAAAVPAPAHAMVDAEEIEAAEIEEVSEEPPAAVSGVRVAPPTPPPARATAAPAAPPDGEPAEPRGRGPRRRRRSKPWYEELFDDSWLATLPAITQSQTEREVGFLADALKLQAGSSVLDVGCGEGRHAVELAARGCEVTGLDLSLPLIIRASDAARRAGANVNFVHGDMREMTFDGQFDAAYCLFTTFGYFDDDTNRAVAALVNKSLKPGGRFLVDVVNRDFLLTEVPARLWWQGEGCMVLEELDFNYFTSRLQNRRSVVFEDARQLEFDISVRAYSLHEIGKLLHAAGFRVTEVSGSPHTRGRFFGGESRQILIVAEKK